MHLLIYLIYKTHFPKPSINDFELSTILDLKDRIESKNSFSAKHLD